MDVAAAARHARAMALFEIDEEGTRKFYRIDVEGTDVVLRWGRIGSEGQAKRRSFATSQLAEIEAKKQRLRRLERGYLEVHDELKPHDPQASRARAEAARLAKDAPLSAAPRFLFQHPKKKTRAWLEQHGSIVKRSDGSQTPHPTHAEAKRALEKEVGELMAAGFVLDTFGAAPPKKKRVRKPPTMVEPPPKLSTSTVTVTVAKPWPPANRSDQRPFDGYTFAFFGEFASWPGYHDGPPDRIAKRRGALVAETVDDSVDVVVIGDLRGQGRAEAKKRADALIARGVPIHVIDEAAYRDLVRFNLEGKRFAFAGGFDCSPSGLEEGTLARMVETAGGLSSEEVDEHLDFLVVGNRRGPSKVALQNKAQKVAAQGGRVQVLTESAFLELVRVEHVEVALGATLDFATFLNRLYGSVDEGKLGRAMAMLRKDRHQLFASLDDAHLIGVVKSQSSDGVYASFLKPNGQYGCATPALEDCMGLQGSVCKHLLVLLVGLVRTGQLPPETALQWVKVTRSKRPKPDRELCADTFIRYKGAEAGELDWRPTETIPEDYYAA